MDGYNVAFSAEFANMSVIAVPRASRLVLSVRFGASHY